MHLLKKLVRLQRFKESGTSMATECTAYRDGRGELYATPERATLADLASVLGRVGEDGGMTNGVAKLILDKREDIERLFAEHDTMMSSASSAETKAGVLSEVGDDQVVEFPS